MAWTTIWDQNFSHLSSGTEPICIISCIFRMCSHGRLVWYECMCTVGQGSHRKRVCRKNISAAVHRMLHISYRSMSFSTSPSVNKSKENVNHTASKHTELFVCGMFPSSGCFRHAASMSSSLSGTKRSNYGVLTDCCTQSAIVRLTEWYCFTCSKMLGGIDTALSTDITPPWELWWKNIRQDAGFQMAFCK